MRDAAERPPLLVFADDWGRHPSSCQHLVRRLNHDYRVVWANTIGTRCVKVDGFSLRRGVEKLKGWHKGLRRVSDQMWVVDLPMLPAVGRGASQIVNERLVGWRLQSIMRRLRLSPPIVVTTIPHMARLSRRLPRRALVYYCTDDFSRWPDANAEAMRQAERDVLAEADLVLGVSRALVNRLGASTSCGYLPHGVDLRHFGSAGALPPHERLAALPGRKIGFFGLVYEKLDFDLLRSVAEAFPHDTLAMIGPVAHCPDSFRHLPNVFFAGQQPYDDLPGWLSGLNILLMPYVDDAMIGQSSPLKLRECLATGKPTVCVDIPEARLFEPHVRIARTREQFLDHVRDALNEGTAPDLAQARQAAVAADDWDCRAAQLSDLLRHLPGA